MFLLPVIAVDSPLISLIPAPAPINTISPTTTVAPVPNVIVNSVLELHCAVAPAPNVCPRIIRLLKTLVADGIFVAALK
ncbi:hypothetical protein D3C73_573970 [compost metagenome]